MPVEGRSLRVWFETHPPSCFLEFLELVVKVFNVLLIASGLGLIGLSTYLLATETVPASHNNLASGTTTAATTTAAAYVTTTTILADAVVTPGHTSSLPFEVRVTSSQDVSSSLTSRHHTTSVPLAGQVNSQRTAVPLTAAGATAGAAGQDGADRTAVALAVAEATAGAAGRDAAALTLAEPLRNQQPQNHLQRLLLATITGNIQSQQQQQQLGEDGPLHIFDPQSASTPINLHAGNAKRRTLARRLRQHAAASNAGGTQHAAVAAAAAATAAATAADGMALPAADATAVELEQPAAGSAGSSGGLVVDAGGTSDAAPRLKVTVPVTYVPWMAWAAGAEGVALCFASVLALAGVWMRSLTVVSSHMVSMALIISSQLCVAVAILCNSGSSGSLVKPADVPMLGLGRDIMYLVLVASLELVAGLELVSFMASVLLRYEYHSAMDRMQDLAEEEANAALRRPLLRVAGGTPAGGTAIGGTTTAVTPAPRNDPWSIRMREQYGLDTTRLTYDPSARQQAAARAARPADDAAPVITSSQRDSTRCSVM